MFFVRGPTFDSRMSGLSSLSPCSTSQKHDQYSEGLARIVPQSKLFQTLSSLTMAAVVVAILMGITVEELFFGESGLLFTFSFSLSGLPVVGEI